MGDTIVAVAAHAADMEFSAGAVLLKHAKQGWDTHIIQLTLGEKGSPHLSPEAYGAQKREEALAASEHLQCSMHFLPYRDGELTASEEVAREVAGLMRELRPRVLVGHWSGSIHADHTAAHDIVQRAIFIAGNKHFDLPAPASGWARLLFADNWEDSDGFEPYVYIDISDELAAWKRAFDCFAIGRGEGGYPYWDWYEARTRLHGIKLRTQHAMAFATAPHGRMVVRDLL